MIRHGIVNVSAERQRRAMTKYVIEAKSTKWFEVEVEAEDELSAYAQLDDWISDDFEEFETGGLWEFEVIETDKADDE
jgi:hypothetical protein